ncbi:MAG TPA: class I SAM-dependent methyltransferase [Bacteroidales bacterium]|nr:class I SAM-dependent methyltransferase [Bacteroidales bacterium]
MNCPSCKSSNISLKNKVDVKLINHYYRKKGIEVGYLFQDIEKLEQQECSNCGLIFFQPAILGDDAYYSGLQRDKNYFYEDKTEFEFSSSYVDSKSKVLDVGCGKGMFSKYIDCEFYQGLDTSSLSVELAKKEGINVINERIQDHSEKFSEFYDVVVLFQVLEHVFNIDDFIDSSLKALKKGGKFIVAVPNNDSFLKDTVNNYFNIPPHHVLQWNEASLLHIAKRYDLKVVEMYKEKVRNVHKSWYYTTLKNKLWRKVFRMNYEICMTRPRLIKLNLLSLFLDPLIVLFKIAKHHTKQDGHTIIAVFEK